MTTILFPGSFDRLPCVRSPIIGIMSDGSDEIEASAEEDESMSGASVQAEILVKNSVKKKGRVGSWKMAPPEAIESFALSTNRVCELLLDQAKALGFIITHSGINKKKQNGWTRTCVVWIGHRN